MICPICKGKKIIHGEVDGTYPTLPCKECQGMGYPDVPTVWTKMSLSDWVDSEGVVVVGDWVLNG